MYLLFLTHTKNLEYARSPENVDFALDNARQSLEIADENIRQMWSILVTMAMNHDEAYAQRVPLVYELLCKWYELKASINRHNSETNVYYSLSLYHVECLILRVTQKSQKKRLLLFLILS